MHPQQCFHLYDHDHDQAVEDWGTHLWCCACLSTSGPRARHHATKVSELKLQASVAGHRVAVSSTERTAMRKLLEKDGKLLNELVPGADYIALEVAEVEQHEPHLALPQSTKD